MKRRYIAAAIVLFVASPALGYVFVDDAEAAAPADLLATMVHWVGEFEPGADLEHYADWVLDKVGVPAEDRDARKPQTGPDGQTAVLEELDMVWLFLTQDEAAKANDLIGQAPLLAAETAGVVSLPTPVHDGGGPLAAPGQMGIQRVPNGVRRIGVPVDEWTSAPSTGGVRVAVVDTGIDGSHDDLEGQVVGGFNCTQDSRGPDGYDIDPHGHGTWVGGSIAAKFNNLYTVSAWPGGSLLSEVTFGVEGSASEAMVLCAVNGALRDHADIISASLGGRHIATRCGGPSVYTNGWCKAARRAVVVVAAGNDALDANLFGPANVPAVGVVTVGAIIDYDGLPGGQGLGYAGCGLFHRDDYLAVFSDWGSTVDVVASGGCELGLLPGQMWGIMSGTSMSTPLVSSVFAAFMARFPDCRGEAAVRTVLGYAQRWADEHPEDGYDGWPGAFPPPMIRFVDEEPLRIQPDPEHPRPCAFESEVVS